MALQSDLKYFQVHRSQFLMHKYSFVCCVTKTGNFTCQSPCSAHILSFHLFCKHFKGLKVGRQKKNRETEAPDKYSMTFSAINICACEQNNSISLISCYEYLNNLMCKISFHKHQHPLVPPPPLAAVSRDNPVNKKEHINLNP